MTIYKLCKRYLTITTFFSASREKPLAMKLHTTVILVIVWLGVFALYTAEGSVASQSMRKLSCVNLSAQKVDIRSIVSYEKQKVPVEAVMFITANGIKICVHPDQKWVQSAMKRVDRRRTTRRR
ncbi:lymphotactin-like [Excalfactoria chinensis]|uniref:lymphotactin-like n=1 Tax=Excalfactoria chinensis TaxID=46218 RepID=UPI003B3A1961